MNKEESKKIKDLSYLINSLVSEKDELERCFEDYKNFKDYGLKIRIFTKNVNGSYIIRDDRMTKIIIDSRIDEINKLIIEAKEQMSNLVK